MHNENYETVAKFLAQGVEVTNVHKNTGVKSTKLVDYNSFFEAVNKNIILKTGLLPLGCRYFSRHSGHVIAMLEEPPRIEEMEFNNKRGDKASFKAKIPFPGVLIGVRLNEGYHVVKSNVWMLKSPIKDMGDLVYHCPFGNTYMGRGPSSGNFCWGNTTGIWKDIKYVHQLRSIINIFYTSKFNSDLSVCFNIPNTLVSEKIETILDLWKFVNKKDKFPTEVLIEAGTFKSAIQAMEGKEE